jgi:capsular exopolysaccharide synthesis family protein
MQGSAVRETGSVDLRDLLSLLWRQKWTIVALTGAVLLGAIVYSLLETPTYASKASVLVESPAPAGGGGSQNTPNMATERLVASSPAVAEAVVKRLRLSEGSDELLRDLSVTVPTDTEALDFTYSHPSPAVAQQRAQAFAEAYLEFRKRKFIQDAGASRDALDAQITTLNRSLNEVTRKAAGAASTAERDLLQSQVTSLTSQIFILQQQLAELDANQNESAGRIVEDASLPERPARPSYLLNGFLGVFVGLMLGVGVVIARQYVGDRIQGSKDLASHVGAPVLGAIPTVRLRRGPATMRLVASHRPNSQAAEAFRQLRANFHMAAMSSNAKTILVTSAQEHEGKTFTTANLGVVLARAGNQVILLSADLRRPYLEQLFGISAASGFANALMSENAASPELMAAGMWSVDPNLTVMPVGVAPENPAELLGSSNMTAFIKELRDSADFVLIDAAPMLGVADAATVAPSCDAALIVADAQSAVRSHVIEAREQLQRLQTRVLGAVLVNAPGSGLKSYRSTTYRV